MKIKTIAMYLPQFHQIPENDEWWGEGFTEWVAAKQATPLFDKHYQPHTPLNDNYYDLIDKKTMRWQADLMKKYEIDGQCIYHYWFKDGRQILEKPAENLLKWTDIAMPFCFCWANESWTRTWSYQGNAWAPKLEPARKENDDGILLEQKYGADKEWKQHFEYLLPFFKDDRYLKIENKPIFMIYKTEKMYCLNEMKIKWDKWAKEAGFSGIYLIGENDHGSDILDMTLLFEPRNALGRLRKVQKESAGIARYNYADIWDEILKYPTDGKKIAIQGISGFDDTPRRGRDGQVIENANPKQFQEYLSELIAKNISNGYEITFINAWNEWGEGMHLEPDKKFGYGFLEGISYAKKNYKRYLEKYKERSFTLDNAKKEIGRLNIINEVYKGYWRLLDTWLTLKENGVKMENVFRLKGISSIAIYGMGMLGKHLYRELENSKINIKYAVDRAASYNDDKIKIYRPGDELPEVDIIVITPTYAYNEISEQLAEKGYTNIVSLEQVMNEWV